MNPERWQQVEDLFAGAMDLPLGEQSRFLAEKCPDAELREEVLSLLGSSAGSGEWIKSVVKDVAGQMPPPPPTRPPAQFAAVEDMVGKRLGAYRVNGTLGRGGMGVVYQAEDERLRRQVAVKLVSREFAERTMGRERFEREARTSSALNHPNICTVFDVGEFEGRPYLVMEALEGQTLRQRLASGGALPFEDALNAGIEIADGLMAAHERGILHRDIKPSNVFITNRGVAKILDFGLAKLLPQNDIQNSHVHQVTQTGILAGTIAYMSPEQVTGKELDARCDLFSFGIVLYEMVTGKYPFDGSSDPAIVNAILHKAPEGLSGSKDRSSGAAIPAELAAVLSKALEKDRDLRYQSAAEFRADLRRVKRATTDSRTPVSVPAKPAFALSRPRRVGLAIAAACIALAATAWSTRSRWDTSSPPLGNLKFTRLTGRPGRELHPSLSPDGRSVVYASNAAGNWDIYLQRVGGDRTINLTAESKFEDTHPAYPPDGEQIAFRSGRDGGGIFVMGATGENVQKVADSGFNPAWSPDGREILFATERTQFPDTRDTMNSEIWAVNAATKERRVVHTGDAMQATWSPSSRRIAYWNTLGGRRNVFTALASGGAAVAVTNDDFMNWNPVWSPDGRHLFFASDRSGSMNIWRVRIDRDSGQVRSAPEAVTTPSLYSGHLSFTANGKRLAYINVIDTSNLRRIGFNPAREETVGQPEPLTGGAREIVAPDISPDGEWLAFQDTVSKQEDLFVMRRDGSGLRRLTNDRYRDRVPRWSADGKRILFYSNRTGRYELWAIQADGSRTEQLTHTSGPSTLHGCESPDGKRIVYNVLGKDPVLMETGKPETARPLPPMPWPGRTMASNSWTSDGRKIAGFGGGSIGIVVYDTVRRSYEQLTDAGRDAMWFKDNRRILYRRGEQVWIVDSVTKRDKKIFSIAPDALNGRAVLAPDEKSIYFSLASVQSDIWMLSFE